MVKLNEVAEAVNQLEIKVALFEQEFKTINSKLDVIEDKVDQKQKIQDIHEKIMGVLLYPKSPINKVGSMARDIRDIAIAIGMIIAGIVVLVKMNLLSLIK